VRNKPSGETSSQQMDAAPELRSGAERTSVSDSKADQCDFSVAYSTNYGKAFLGSAEVLLGSKVDLQGAVNSYLLPLRFPSIERRSTVICRVKNTSNGLHHLAHCFMTS
jgi:hypothetical protein